MIRNKRVFTAAGWTVRRNRCFAIFIFVAAVFSLFINTKPLNAETQSPLSFTFEKEFVTISIGEWPPYTSINQKHNGVIAHIITDIFKEMGLKVQFQNMPWARAYEEAASGRFDGTGVWMHKSEREKDFIYSDPILNERFVFFHLKSDALEWSSLSDLKGSVMGGVRQSSYGPEMDAAINSGILTMSRVTHFRQNFFRLLEGRIRLFPMELNVGYSTLKQYVPKDKQNLITHHPKPFLENFSYVLFPRKNQESKKLVAAFNKRLKEFRRTGRYDRYFVDLEAGKYDLEKGKD